MKPKILFLFPQEWDVAGLHALRDEVEVVFEGFDLFRFPGNARLLWFDAPGYVDRLARRYAGAGLAGVMSTNEQYGALIAAVLARRLGLPGTDPKAILHAQHKYYARLAHQAAIPEATPEFAVFPYRLRDHADVGIAYPFFVKPVKAAHSVLARRVDTPEALRRHLAFRPWEKHIIKRLVRPFADLLPLYTDFAIGPEHLIGEGILPGRHQVTVDGWRDARGTRIVGVTDSVMYPGTQAFQRFDCPSVLPAAVQERMGALAVRAVEALGFDHGCFNVEMIWDDESDRIGVIEVNPRLAAQFGDLWANVNGLDTYAILLDLTLGRSVRPQPAAGPCGAAASFVYREFGDGVPREPPAAQRRWLAAAYPDARLHTYIKHGNARRREMKWLGSYRYAVLNLGGHDRADLFARHEDIDAHVRFGPEAGAQIGHYAPETGPD